MTSVLRSLNRALGACLAEDERVILLGEDLLDPYGGAFKVVQGLSTAYPQRVITTPVSEAGIVGVGVGMAMRGLRPVVEIMFGDFLALAADQLINHAAKMSWISGGRVNVPLVVRTPMGGRRGYGPTHSQSLEKHFLGVPGLRVVAVTAIGVPGEILSHAILEDDDPVLCIEHKMLYTCEARQLDGLGEFSGESHGQGYPSYHLRIAHAPPASVTVLAYGYTAELACEAILQLAYRHEIFCELLVPTQLSPFRLDLLLGCVRVTKRLLVVEEGSRQLGWGAEVLAQMLEASVPGLHASRLAALDMPIPVAPALVHAVLPGVEDIVRSVRALAG